MQLTAPMRGFWQLIVTDRGQTYTRGGERASCTFLNCSGRYPNRICVRMENLPGWPNTSFWMAMRVHMTIITPNTVYC